MLTANERNATLKSAIQAAVDAGIKRMRCACPGIVQAWNSETQTVSVKLALKEVLRIDEVNQEIEIPMLVDVPVVMPRAGGFCLLMVPCAGDECLVVFSDMCIDAWWQSGGVQSQAEFRRHDLSDGFAIMGCWSQVKKPTFPASGIKLQNDAGTDFVSIDDSGVHFSNADFGIHDLYSNLYGVAVGMQPTATQIDKKFEVAADHTAEFNGELHAKNDSVFDAPVTFQDDIDFSGIDSGWQTVTLSGCTEYSDDWLVRVRKLKDAVYIRGGVKLNAALTSAAPGSTAGVLTILTLPSGFAPTYEAAYPIVLDKSSNGYLYCRVGTDGSVTLYNRSGYSVSSSVLIPLSITYLRQ